MLFEKFQFQHKNTIDRFNKSTNLQSADSTFTNLWLWRFDRDIEIFADENMTLIRVTKDENRYYHFPLTSDLASAADQLLSIEDEVVFRAVTSDQLQMLKNLDGYRVEFEKTPNHFDYIYETSNMIELKGRAYHGKKNFVNRFITRYGSSYEVLTDQSKDELVGFVDGWFENSPYKNEAEKQGIISAIEKYQELDIKVGLIRADGKIAAFTISELVSSEMVVIHVEKADGSYQGSYQAINQMHLANTHSEVKYTNREEDLGIEGLKKAKLSYHPSHFTEKFEVKLSRS